MGILSLTAPPPPLITRSITIVVAARNEEGNLENLLICLEQAFQELGFILPVLLIDDGSTDGSLQILERLQIKYSFLKVISHGQSQSLIGVLKTALANTSTDWLYLTPADLESKPQTDLPLLLKACKEDVDAVAGWRQGRKDGKNLASFVANFSCRLAFGLNIHDMNWIKLIRRDLLAVIPLEIVSHAYILPVLTAWGYHVTEVPTPWHPRQAGKSKFGYKRLITSAIKFWQLWWWFQIKGRQIISKQSV